MFNVKTLCTMVSVIALLGAPAYAGEMCHGMASPKLSKALRKNPAVQDYIAANKSMHKGMDIGYTGNSDIDFVAGMIPHHQGAVDMAWVELEYGNDETMKALARRIIAWQKSEIGNMKQWLAGRQSCWQAPNVESLPSVVAYKEAMHKMHSDMNIEYTGNADIDFARGMIPHHQGAIDMAWIEKKYGMDMHLRAFSDEIIRSQGQEIRLMQEWLAKQPVAAETKTKKKKNHGHTQH